MRPPKGSYLFASIALFVFASLCYFAWEHHNSELSQERDDNEFVHDMMRSVSGGDGVWTMREKADFLRFCGIDHVLQDGDRVTIRKEGSAVSVEVMIGTSLSMTKAVTREKLEEYRPPSE